MRLIAAPETLTIAVTLAGVSTVFSLWAFFTVGDQVSDFGAFYRSGSLWRSGLSPYTTQPPNLNNPAVTAWLFAPLSQLSFNQARMLWTAMNAAAAVLVFRAVVRELKLSRKGAAWMAAMLFGTFGGFYAWLEGQISWLVLVPLTLSWKAYRAGNLRVAGLWLAPAVFVKPALVATALLLPARIAVPTAAASVLLAGISVPLTKWHHWMKWLETGSSVSHLAYPANGSLWGVAARFQTGNDQGVAIAAINPTLAAVVLVIIGVLAYRTWQTADPDARMSRGLVVGLLAAPLGWVYYTPWLLGPLAARWFPSAWHIAAVAAACVPVPLFVEAWQDSPTVLNLVGMPYTAALVCAWIAVGYGRPSPSSTGR